MENTSIKTFKKGERILTKGDEALCAYMILEGKVTVFLDESTRRVELATLGKDEIFGETAILSGGTYGAHVEATDDCTLQIITPQSLEDLIANADPTLQNLMHMIMQRLTATNQALLKSETREFMDVAFI